MDAIAGRRENVLEGLLGSLSADAVAVLAGREPPPTALRTDPGWRAVLNTVRLENLGADEGRALLRLRGVPEAAHDGALAFTHGHPLALALLADVVAQSAGDEPVAATPEVLMVLLDSLVRSVPSEAHLAALEACSQVAVTTEPLLAALLGSPTHGRSSTGSASCPSWTSPPVASTRTTSRGRRWPASCPGATPRRTTGCTAARGRSTSACSRAPTPPPLAGCSSTSRSCTGTARSSGRSCGT